MSPRLGGPPGFALAKQTLGSCHAKSLGAESLLTSSDSQLHEGGHRPVSYPPPGTIMLSMCTLNLNLCSHLPGHVASQLLIPSTGAEC